MTTVPAEWLMLQRWCANDALEPDEAAIEAVTTCIDGWVGMTIATVGADHYQLLSAGERPDAFDDPRVATALLRQMAAGSRAFGQAGTVTFHPVAGRPAPVGETRPIPGEQSNSSIVIGEHAVLKVLRRLRPGTHPEVEMLAELGARNCTHVPALLGWYEVDGGPIDATLGILQQFVAGGLDGWQLVLDRLRHQPRSTIRLLHDLGATLAEIHADLGAAGGDDAFAPIDGGKAMAAQLGEAVAAEAAHLAAVQTALASDLEGAALAASRLSYRLDAGPAIRHHGDLHLGQTLWCGDRWVIIDWEGEPGRPLDQRRTKQSPLVDVAGMLRSFAYAHATHERTVGTPCPGWEQAARAAFLDGYLAHADPALLPANPVTIERLLKLLELRKAIYEIGYEARHRPDWIDIPVAGLRRIIVGLAQ